MPGNPFRASATDIATVSIAAATTPYRTSSLRDPSSTGSRSSKVKKVQFVSPVESPDEPDDDDTSWPHHDARPMVKSPPPSGQSGFGVDIKSLLQHGTSSEVSTEQAVAAMMAQQRLAAGSVGIDRSGGPPHNPFAKTLTDRSDEGHTDQVATTTKMDVDAFTRMLLTGSSTARAPRPPAGNTSDAREQRSPSVSSSNSASPSDVDEDDDRDDDNDYDDEEHIGRRAEERLTDDNSSSVETRAAPPAGDKRVTRPPPPPPTSRRQAVAKTSDMSTARNRSDSDQTRPSTQEVPVPVAQDGTRRQTLDTPPVRTKGPPRPPPSRHTGRSISTDSTAERALAAAALVAVATTAGAAPPKPPPPRRRGDANHSSISQSTQDSRHEAADRNGENKHVYMARASTSSSSSPKPVPLPRAPDMLADLDALQREVDALRSKVGHATIIDE